MPGNYISLAKHLDYNGRNVPLAFNIAYLLAVAVAIGVLAGNLWAVHEDQEMILNHGLPSSALVLDKRVDRLKRGLPDLLVLFRFREATNTAGLERDKTADQWQSVWPDFYEHVNTGDNVRTLCNPRQLLDCFPKGHAQQVPFWAMGAYLFLRGLFSCLLLAVPWSIAGMIYRGITRRAPVLPPPYAT